MTLILFVTPLMLMLLVLIPAQPAAALAGELIGASLVIGVAMLVIDPGLGDRRAAQRLGASGGDTALSSRRSRRARQAAPLLVRLTQAPNRA